MWWQFLIVGLLGAWVTLVLHELAHCLVVWFEGGRVLGFKPYPHWHDGRFYFGRMTWESSAPLHHPRFFYAAPALIKAPVLLTLWLFLGLLFWRPLLVAAFWEAMDTLNFVQGYIRNSNNDGGRFRRS